MKIIIATPSPYARKARVALREKKIDFEEIIDVPWNTNTLTKGINPLGKIPVLLHDDHKPLFDSNVIVQYLDHYEPQPLLYPENPEDNISARVVETIADGDKYVGKYKNGKFHGQGTYTFANGKVIEGIWENGKKVVVTKT